MSKVQVTADGLRALYSHAKSAGTIGAWAEVALEWADKAESELARLKAIELAVPAALVELDHIASEDCECDDSVGLRCMACSARVAANALRKAAEAAKEKT